MNTIATEIERPHPVDVRLPPALENRDRMTAAFRLILAIPHLLLVGAPAAVFLSWTWGARDSGFQWSSTGVLGAAAGICAVIAWFAILFTGRYPEGLRGVVLLYLRWRVRAVAYTALLRDEYPPFGDGDYPAELVLGLPEGPRDRISVAFRLILAIPHILAVWLLGVAWCLATIIAWVLILMTGTTRKSSTASGWACCAGTSGWRRTCSCFTTSTRRSRWRKTRSGNGLHDFLREAPR